MKTLELLKEQSVSEGSQNNSNSSELEYNGEQIENTPVVSRHDNERGWFGTVGQYRVTNFFEKLENLIQYVKEMDITWEQLAIMSAAQYDLMKVELKNLQRELTEVINNK